MGWHIMPIEVASMSKLLLSRVIRKEIMQHVQRAYQKQNASTQDWKSFFTMKKRCTVATIFGDIAAIKHLLQTDIRGRYDKGIFLPKAETDFC
jgi:hypothetical protein